MHTYYICTYVCTYVDAIHVRIQCNVYLFRSGCKDKNSSSKPTSVEMTKASSIQGLPTDLTYAEIAKPDAHTGPTQCYARMSALKVRV